MTQDDLKRKNHTGGSAAEAPEAASAARTRCENHTAEACGCAAGEESGAEAPLCARGHEHHRENASVTPAIPPDEALCRLAEFYKVFGDGTRIRILYALYGGERCVCEIADLLGMTLSAISHQLRILKQARLVKYRREGKAVYYALSDDHVRTILAMGAEHLEE